MDISDIPRLLAEIGTEARKLCGLHYEITFHLTDGECVTLVTERPVTDISKRMHRICRWLARRAQNQVDYIEVCPLGSRCGSHYVVCRHWRAA